MPYFLSEPILTQYTSDKNPNALLTPEKYLHTNQYKFAPFANTDPWFQPNRDYNYYMINSNNIINNKQYRKYMTHHNKEIINYNSALYAKQ
jgi:hypothetical protein